MKNEISPQKKIFLIEIFSKKGAFSKKEMFLQERKNRKRRINKKRNTREESGEGAAKSK